MGENSTEVNQITSPLPPLLSRRDFLVGAAACAAVGPTVLRAVVRGPDRPTLLHLATMNSRIGYVHTYALTSVGCRLLGSTKVDSFAAFAVHPLLPVLYVARDCRHWEDLPRGAIETYVVEHGIRPLSLVAQTPMALSATGPRSLAVSPCGRHLLVSASTGGAWNAFALNCDGVPASVAIARKETGVAVNSHTISLPTPHGLAFSPRAPFAVGTDPGSGRVTLLRPSSEGIATIARRYTPYGLSSSPPVWTSDGRFVVVSNARNASLSIFEIEATPKDGDNTGFHLLATRSTATQVTTLLAHPTQSAFFTSRPQNDGGRLELWKIQGTSLRPLSDTWLPDRIVAFTEHAGMLWVVTQDRLIRIPIEDLRSPSMFQVPLPMRDPQAIITQNLAS